MSKKIGQLKMQSSDGKYYKTNVADTEQIFRLIQYIPSPNAEPFKLWLAELASERLDEMQDPEISTRISPLWGFDDLLLLQISTIISPLWGFDNLLLF